MKEHDTSESLTATAAQAAHTPGPWMNSFDPAKVWSEAGEFICICIESRSELVTEREKANARLIAAAPDLLRELQDILEWAIIAKAPLRKQEIESIRCAIAKATGQQ